MSTNVNVFCSLISLLGITFLVFWLYRDYRLDTLRQQMFALRDSLFNEAVEGSIAFDHPAYGLLRTTMNGMVRFAHRINFFHSIFLYFIYKEHKDELPRSFADRFDKAVEDLPDDQQELVRSYQFSMNLIIARHIVLSSPLLLLLLAFEVFHRVNKLVDLLRRPIDQFDSMALVEGEI